MNTLKTILITLSLIIGYSSLASAGEEALFKGVQYKCKNYKSGKIKDAKGLSRASLIEKAKKLCGHVGLKDFHIFGFLGAFKADQYEVLSYSCQDFNKIFQERDPKCKSQIEWKQIAKKRCAKISLMPRKLTSYKVSKKCKIRSLKKEVTPSSTFFRRTSK